MSETSVVDSILFFLTCASGGLIGFGLVELIRYCVEHGGRAIRRGRFEKMYPKRTKYPVDPSWSREK